MSSASSDLLEQLDRHLASPNLAWLFGAGISYAAHIPLMGALTTRVFEILAADSSAHLALVKGIFDDLPDGAHVEHLLSQLGDYSAVADRSRSKTATIAGAPVTSATLSEAHDAIVRAIARTVRWGYRPPGPDAAVQPAAIGSHEHPLVEVGAHKAFVQAMFNTTQAGLEARRGPIRFFTTNYDTLLEDALALECIGYWDGFDGGAVGFRSHHFGAPGPEERHRAHVVKLHGSVDWRLGVDGRVWRVRDGDTYPARGIPVLIYPQATKYLATQRDPFAAQFDLFRRHLSGGGDNVLGVCGYSFGDDHINDEIEMAMGRADSRTTLLAFARTSGGIPERLEGWRMGAWGARVYIVSDLGLYVGKADPVHPPPAGGAHDWWTFSGLTRLLQGGTGAFSL